MAQESARPGPQGNQPHLVWILVFDSFSNVGCPRGVAQNSFSNTFWVQIYQTNTRPSLGFAVPEAQMLMMDWSKNPWRECKPFHQVLVYLRHPAVELDFPTRTRVIYHWMNLLFHLSLMKSFIPLVMLNTSFLEIIFCAASHWQWNISFQNQEAWNAC